MYNKSAKCHLNHHQTRGAVPWNTQLLSRGSSGVCFMHIIFAELHSQVSHDNVCLKHVLLQVVYLRLSCVAQLFKSCMCPSFLCDYMHQNFDKLSWGILFTINNNRTRQ